MKKLLLIFLLAAAAVGLRAQDPGRADNLFLQGDYATALRHYRLLHRDYPGTVLYTYRLGRCEQELGMYELAVQHLIEAGDRYSMRPFWLARAAYRTYRFDLAKEMFEEFLDSNEPSESHYAAAEEELRKAEQGARFFNRIENIVLVDTVSFPIDSLSAHLPVLSSDMGKIAVENGRFVSTNERGDRRFFSFTDIKSGRTLIGKQERLLDRWTEIDTLPNTVNQWAQQQYPFLMPDGVTLYFSARSEQGLGGWDIYVTKYNPSTNTYLTPEPLGMPFNSFDDDLLFLYDEALGQGCFLTDRASADGLFTLYSFRREEPYFLREREDDYLRSYVQLSDVPWADAASPALPGYESLVSPVLAELAKPAPEWELIVNDSTVYTALSDFRNADARLKMEEFLDLSRQIAEEEADLQARRLLYAQAESTDEKATLAPLILSLEQDIHRLKRELQELHYETLRLELH